MDSVTSNLIKRKTSCGLLGILCGLVCCALAASGGKVEVWGTPLMWSILWNRLLIGFVIFLAGFLNYHVMFKFRMWSWFRGAACGAVVSIGPAIGSLMGPQGYVPEAVWGFVVMGAVYGLFIDVIATWIAGDGRALVGEWTR